MSLDEFLQHASFRGVPFLVDTSKTKRGKTIKIEEMPEGSSRVIEVEGKLPPTFSLVCIVSGEDSLAKRRRLEHVFDHKEGGILVHPEYGAVKIHIGEYEVDSTQRRIGEYKFTVTMYTFRDIIVPKVANSKSAIDAQLKKAQASISNAIGIDYPNPDTSFSLTAAANSIAKVFGSVKDVIDGVLLPINDVVAELTDSIETIIDSAYKISTSAQTLKNSVANLYSQINELKNTPAALFEVWSKIAEPIDFHEKSSITQERAGIAKRDDIIYDQSILYGIAGLYGTLSLIDPTSNELGNIIYEIDLLYSQNIIDHSIDGYSLIGNADIRRELSQLREMSIEFSQTRPDSNNNLIPLTVDLTSLALLNYQTHGDIDDVELMLSVNKQDPSAYKGEVKVPEWQSH